MIFRKNKQGKRGSIIGLDLGSHQIKAVVLEREDAALKLARYVVFPSSAGASKAGSAEKLATELQEVMTQLGGGDGGVHVSVSCPSATVCEAEFPRMPLDEVRSALRMPVNANRYLRRDLTGYYVDAIELSEVESDSKNKKSQTMRLLVAAADKEEVRWYCGALEAAKIPPQAIGLSALTVVNAFHIGNAELCEKEVVLLLDIGAHSTSISVLRKGQPSMTRIMHFGGYQISEFIGSILTLEPNAAEEEKIKMTDVVQPLVRQALSPLAREVRSSIDFFERQQECHVSRAYACGGSACSASVLDFLSEEVGFHIESWNPIQALSTVHFNGEAPKLASLAPTLAAAIGTAVPHL